VIFHLTPLSVIQAGQPGEKYAKEQPHRQGKVPRPLAASTNGICACYQGVAEFALVAAAPPDLRQPLARDAGFGGGAIVCRAFITPFIEAVRRAFHILLTRSIGDFDKRRNKRFLSMFPS